MEASWNGSEIRGGVIMPTNDAQRVVDLMRTQSEQTVKFVMELANCDMETAMQLWEEARQLKEAQRLDY